MQEQFLGEEKTDLLLAPHEFTLGQAELDLDRGVLHVEQQIAIGGDSKYWEGRRDERQEMPNSGRNGVACTAAGGILVVVLARLMATQSSLAIRLRHFAF